MKPAAPIGDAGTKFEKNSQFFDTFKDFFPIIKHSKKYGIYMA
jgi:hypothetical protein